MESAARVLVTTHDVAAIVDSESHGCDRTRNINRSVNAVAQQEAMQIAKHVRVEIVFLDRCVVGIGRDNISGSIQAAVMAANRRGRHLRGFRKVPNGNKTSTAQQQQMKLLVAAALVTSDDQTAVVDLPNVRVSRAGKINRGEHAAPQQKPMMFPLLLVD